MRVTDGTTTFFTDDPRLVAALAPADLDHNGDLTLADFAGTPAIRRTDEFIRVVSQAFRTAGRVRTDQQVEAVAQLLRLGNRIDQLDAYVLHLVTAQIGADGGALQVDRSTWIDRVLPAMRRNGPLSPEAIGALPTELLSAIVSLTSRPELASARIGHSDCGDTTGLTYQEAALPAELRRVVRRITVQYLTSTAWLLGYQTLTCAGTNWWSDGDCPPGEPITLWRIPQLESINAGPRTDLQHVYCSPPEHVETITCFPGDTYVLTEAGPLALNMLATLAAAQRPLSLWGGQGRSGVSCCIARGSDDCDATERSIAHDSSGGEGEALHTPRIATIDERTGHVTFQHPSAVITHLEASATLLDLALLNQSGVATTLSVTDNHPLWIERDGTRQWLPAVMLRDGDLVVTPDGRFAAFSARDTVSTRGAFDLYDIHFDGSPHTPNHTFLVSPDAAHWFVAHNKPF